MAPKKKKRISAGPKKPDPALKRIKTLIRNRPPFRDERPAPKVDAILLLALIRQELPERTAREVHRWVILFKSWSDAYCDLLVREYRETWGSSMNGD